MNIINKSVNIYIYNSLKKKKELFVPINNNNIGMYVCGPTVYNHLHLGNYRTFIVFDIIFRYFKHLGYKVCYVRNITDVGHLEDNQNEINSEDKIIKKSRKEGIPPMEVVNKYTISFHKFLNILNTLSPNIEPTATGHIIEQIEFIKKLIYNNYAYEINGSVYFDLKKYINTYSYGILSGNDLKNLSHYERKHNKEKRFIHDFCLWKKADEKHIMKWPSPWSYGYPGWHTECVTMSTKYLGNIFDIHGGGIDLKFPHHECELAQSNAFYGKKSYSRYWIHTNMLIINGKKMSKSLGNNLTIKDLLYQDYSPNVLKLFMLQHHYRSIIDFSIEKLIETKKGYNKIKYTIEILENFIPIIHNKKNIKLNFNIYNWIYKCYKSINNDFNTPMLISNLFYASKFIMLEVHHITKIDFNLLKKYMNYFIFDILGLSKLELLKTSNKKNKKFDILVEKLIHFRKEMREKKNWGISDRLRKELYDVGININDKQLL
ncbi:cysteine--tRNA ligase [Blattabacterium cuenoti]|uniref:cysteine--tRNA ligase n=1 Tax=Blattabacterium cuenoti TaxID=1653831 RepID=UPI00163B94CB|nr:cysteine--tRNA ligase [Blattabacterium cuenoti]